MVTQYVNKATLNGTSTVYWVTSGAPDSTGAQSGYNPANLTNIAVDYTTTSSTTNTGGTVNPSAVGVRIPPDGYDVLVWTLSENSSFANTGSASGISNLSVLGTVNTSRVGLFGNAPEFPSSGQNSIHGASTYGSAIGNNLTISCWFNAESVNTGTTQYLVFKGYNTSWSGAFGIGLGLTFNNNTIAYDLSIGGADVGLNLTVGKIFTGIWYHVGMTYDGANVKIYLNGDLISSVAQTGNIDWGSNNQDWAIGNNHIPATANRPFIGKIDDVRIANIARPASYFQSVYQLGIGYGATSISAPQLVTFSDGYNNLPIPGVAGRLFLPTDTNKPVIYRDNGTSWKPFSSGTIVDTFANRPISGANGQLFIPSDGGYQQVWDGSKWRPIIANVLCTEPPSASTFTQSNFSTSTLTKSNGGLIFNMVPATDPSYRAALISIPTPSNCQIQTLSSLLNNVISGASTAYPASGLIMVESTTGKAATIYTFLETDNLNYRRGVGVVTWGSTTNRIIVQDYHQMDMYPALFIRLRISSGTLYYETSNDLVNWNTLSSMSVTSVFTSAPDQYGVAAFHFGSITSNTYSHFKHLYLG